MMLIGLCQSGDYACAQSLIARTIVALVLIGLAIDVILPNRKNWARRIDEFLSTPKRDNLILILLPQSGNSVELNVFNGEWRYRREAVCVVGKHAVEVSSETRRGIYGDVTTTESAVFTGRLRWIPELNRRFKNVKAWNNVRVEFIRINPEIGKFLVSYGYETEDSVQEYEFAAGNYKFEITIVGEVIGKNHLVDYRVENHYDVEVSYDGFDSISANMKNVNSSFQSKPVKQPSLKVKLA